MKNSTFYTIVLSCIVFILASCSDEKYIGPIDNDTAPGSLTGVTVTPLPGAARITYELPDDKSLRYVKAVYEIRPGVEKETKSSKYTDELFVDGFPEIKPYQVKLTTVSNGEKESEPQVIEVTPLLSPLKEAYNSLIFNETFGGVTINFENSGAASLAVTIITDSAGTVKEVDTYYTQSIQGSYSVRGFPAEPTTFGAVIRDRWGNYSDTITQTLTPVFEEYISKEHFAEYNLPTDTYEPHISQGQLYQLWDERRSPTGGHGVFHTKPGSGMPQWFTFDMGRVALLSRYKLYHRGGQGSDVWAYDHGSPRRWEVWGTAETPDPSGGWDNWIKLMDCNSYKPSGDGPITSEDLYYATDAGEDFEFPVDIPPVRYLRFKILETWGYLDYIYISELSFWGTVM